MIGFIVGTLIFWVVIGLIIAVPVGRMLRKRSNER